MDDSKKMKVLHIIPSISKKRGGPSTAIISMVRELRQQGVDASILTTSDNEKYKEDNKPVGRWFYVDNVPVMMFPSIGGKSKLIREYLISPSLTCWLLQNIDSYDLLHIHAIFSYCSSISMLLARLKNVPYIVRTIGQLNSWSLSQSRFRKLLMLSLLERSNLLHASAIHVTSNYEKNDLVKICNHKNVFCLGLGVETAQFPNYQRDTKQSCKRFVFLSRIHPKKQLDVLLKAFSYLYRHLNNKSWCLYIAGDGDSDYIASLRNYAEINGISANLKWMGHLGEEQKSELLRSADWYVLPSKSENFGLSVVESLANGLPVIISSEVGISDIVLDYKAGMVINDSAGLVDALLIAQKGPCKEMRDAATKLAREQFSWTEITKRLILFYKSQLI